MTSPQPLATQTLAGRLMTVQNNYVLGLASLALLTAPEAGALLRRDAAHFGTYEVQFAQIADLFAHPAHREDACRSFLVMHMCSLVKDSFELCTHHARAANRLQEMKAEPWHQFCRLVRHCIAHKFIFDFRPYDLSILPARWRGREITAAHNGQELPLALFGYEQAWEMFMDIRTFAERTGV
jgi:hypothetical protein